MANSPTHLDDLAKRLTRYEFDDPTSSMPFTARLAAENLWSLDFARSVVREYKRFAYLAMMGDGPVTPSDEVDQVWHLHVLYTREYDHFCSDVLGRKLHHGPTRGREQNAHFKEQYKRTLRRYLTVFGHRPPSNVWPPADVRFGRRYVRLCVNDSNPVISVLVRLATLMKRISR